MPRAKKIGYVAGRTLRDLGEAHEIDADLIADAMADLLDGDGDTTRAQRILLRLNRNIGKQAGVLNHLERGDMQEAEDAAAALIRDARKL